MLNELAEDVKVPLVKLHPAHGRLREALLKLTGSDSTIINAASDDGDFKVRPPSPPPPRARCPPEGRDRRAAFDRPPDSRARSEKRAGGGADRLLCTTIALAVSSATCGARAL